MKNNVATGIGAQNVETLRAETAEKRLIFPHDTFWTDEEITRRIVTNWKKSDIFWNNSLSSFFCVIILQKLFYFAESMSLKIRFMFTKNMVVAAWIVIDSSP